MKTMLYGLAVIGLVSVASQEANAQQTTITQTERTTVRKFTPVERKVIREHVTIQNDEVITPDVESKIIVGETLPVTVFERAHPITSDVVVGLPEQPAGTKLIIVKDKVVRVSEPDHKIVDVFDLDDLQENVEKDQHRN